MKKQKFFDEVVAILNKDKRFVSGAGELMRNAVYEAAMKMDDQLLKLLYANAATKNAFFKKVGEIAVFDKQEFGWTVSNEEFLPDSYTRFRNKIGLANENGEYLTSSREIELVFPYKDCVLEGGQTKDDQKRDELFYNRTLAPDEVNRLLEPKVLTNAVRYDEKGVRATKEIDICKDNLIIRGNNLLSLASLEKCFAGSVKCIYIDPPYNIGGDDFRYNDKFNHSSWLVFMKNRLEIAHRLLRRDGAIFVQIDHHELAYTIALMDETFGRENKVQIISVKTASPAGFKTVNPGPIDVTEYVLFYTKNKSHFDFRKAYVPVEYNKNYNLVLERNNDLKKWKFVPIKEAVLKDAGFKSERDAKKTYGEAWSAIIKGMIAQYAYDHADNVVSVRDPHKPTQQLKDLMARSRSVEYPLSYEREDGTTAYVYKGGALAFYSSKMQMIDGVKTVTELLTDFWGHISWAGIAKEGGVKLKNGKKPERLIKQIFELSTSPGDLVLDYHLGSGTTAAVAHKMGLRYIGCEQLDYGENDAVARLRNVVEGDSTGISESIGWKGGGAFVYCELAKSNQVFVERIEKAKKDAELKKIWEEMFATGFISCKLDPAKFSPDDEEYIALPLKDKKRILMDLLDLNQLYVNYCDMEDKTFKISAADKAFTKSFYEGK